MPVKKSTAAMRKRSETDESQAVNQWISACRHPLKPLIQSIRTAILASSPKITEGIKWNAPSFYCGEWFATVNAHGKQAVLVVLHLGVKTQRSATLRATIRDTDALLRWRAADRATISFASEAEFESHRRSFVTILRQWVKACRQLQKTPAKRSHATGGTRTPMGLPTRS